jgi:hypothetical protein
MSPTAFTPTIGKDTQKLHVRYEVGPSTSGATTVSGSWQTYPLQTTKLNEIPGAALVSNVLTLPAGTYRLKGWITMYRGENRQIRLYDTGNSARLVEGELGFFSSGTNGNANLSIDGVFTLTATTTVEFQYRVQSGIGSGLGVSVSWVDTAVYGDLTIEREIPAINDGNGEYVRGPMVHYREQQSPGTSSGAGTAATWTTRTLNTVVQAGIVGASLSSNQFTLPAGDYEVEYRSPHRNVNYNRARIRNITDSTTPSFSDTHEHNTAAAAVHGITRTAGPDRFSITSPKTFEMQYWFSTNSNINNLGATGSGSGEDEIFGEVRIWKLVRAGVQETDPTTKPLAIVREQHPSSTIAPSSTAATWNTRALNTLQINEVGASLSSNQVTLPAGTYYVEAEAEGVVTNDQRVRIRKVSGTAATLVLGLGARAGSGLSYVTEAVLKGRFTLTEESTIELQHYTESAGVLGDRHQLSGIDEVFSEMLLWKLD